MVLKFLGFALLYLVYIALVFAGMALVVKYAYELNLERLLPPAVTMTALLLVLIALIGLPPLLVSLNYARPSGWQRRLLQTGRAAPAQIISVEDSGVSLGNPDLGFVVRVRLRVQPDSGVSFEATLETPVSRVAIPRVGDWLRVRYDPRDHRRIVLETRSG